MIYKHYSDNSSVYTQVCFEKSETVEIVRNSFTHDCQIVFIPYNFRHTISYYPAVTFPTVGEEEQPVHWLDIPIDHTENTGNPS